MIQVLFVCLGNICRSPAAEAVFTRQVADAGLQDRIRCDSCGTGDYHIGEPADPRMRAAAAARGYRVDRHRARQFHETGDFHRFDCIVAMDDDNLASLRSLAHEPDDQARLHRMVDFLPAPGADRIPDPYHGGPEGFEQVLDLLESACAGLLEHIRKEHAP